MKQAGSHEDLESGRWWQLTLYEQLAHVGSEVGRAIRWRPRNERIADGALARALDLMDLTLSDPRHRLRPGRLRELARVREVLVDYLAGANDYGSTAESLLRYFDVFAVAAGRSRGL